VAPIATGSNRPAFGTLRVFNDNPRAMQQKLKSRTPRLWLKLNPTQARHIVVPPRERRTAEEDMASITAGLSGTILRGCNVSATVRPHEASQEFRILNHQQRSRLLPCVFPLSPSIASVHNVAGSPTPPSKGAMGEFFCIAPEISSSFPFPW
jgi:hypothetical protein